MGIALHATEMQEDTVQAARVKVSFSLFLTKVSGTSCRGLSCFGKNRNKWTQNEGRLRRKGAPWDFLQQLSGPVL